MRLDEIFSAKPPSNRTVWRKRADKVEKAYEVEPRINDRTVIVRKGNSGKQQ